MDLKETMDEALKELNKIPLHLEKWQTLREELKKRELEDHLMKIRKVEIEEAEKIMVVLEKLTERFNYKKIINTENSDKQSSSDFNRILELSRLEGNVLDMLDSLADTGYHLGYAYEKNKNIIENDIDYFKRLLKDDMFKKYKVVFNTLKFCLGYEFDDDSKIFPFYSHQFNKIMKISELEEDICIIEGAINLLANKGHQINKITGITESDIKAIEKITKSLQKDKCSFETVSLLLYDEGNPEGFKNYFSGLSKDKQKTVLNKIFNLDYENKKVTNWLNEKHYDILREAGLF